MTDEEREKLKDEVRKQPILDNLSEAEKEEVVENAVTVGINLSTFISVLQSMLILVILFLVMLSLVKHGAFVILEKAP